MYIGDSKNESRYVDCCKYCFGNIHKEETIFHYIQKESMLCGKCRKQLKLINKSAKFEKLKITMLYEYNDFMESMIFQFKEGRDIALKEVFFHEFIRNINDKFRHYTVILMPSSKEKMMERGFLPLKEMLSECTIPIIEPFYKINNHKQSLQSLEDRKLISQVMYRNEAINIPKTPLLLVDDVCTSGSTIFSAYHKLLPHTYNVEALVLAVHPLFVEKCDEKRLLKKSGFSIL